MLVRKLEYLCFTPGCNSIEITATASAAQALLATSVSFNSQLPQIVADGLQLCRHLEKTPILSHSSHNISLPRTYGLLYMLSSWAVRAAPKKLCGKQRKPVGSFVDSSSKLHHQILHLSPRSQKPFARSVPKRSSRLQDLSPRELLELQVERQLRRNHVSHSHSSDLLHLCRADAICHSS